MRSRTVLLLVVVLLAAACSRGTDSGVAAHHHQGGGRSAGYGGVRDSFLASCVGTAGERSRPACQCSFDHISHEIPFEEYDRYQTALRTDIHATPPDGF